jgi:SAM-dependent methyltransferase
MLKKWLAHPDTRGLDIDNPRLTELRRRIILEKKFLHQIYQEWYQAIAASLPVGDDLVLEIGSGAGFMQEFVPGLVKSEIFGCPGMDVILNALTLPFASGSLRAIVMTDVLHHLPETQLFFSESARCIRVGGIIAMIEPWVSPWSQWVYGHLHHEPFDVETADWSFPATGPLSGANGALPWIIFERDRTRFEHEFPEWTIRTIRPQMPFRYLVSGGVSMRNLMPGGTFGIWHRVENILNPLMKYIAMFSLIVLERV